MEWVLGVLFVMLDRQAHNLVPCALINLFPSLALVLWGYYYYYYGVIWIHYSSFNGLGQHKTKEVVVPLFSHLQLNGQTFPVKLSQLYQQFCHATATPSQPRKALGVENWEKITLNWTEIRVSSQPVWKVGFQIIIWTGLSLPTQK